MRIDYLGVTLRMLCPKMLPVRGGDQQGRVRMSRPARSDRDTTESDRVPSETLQATRLSDAVTVRSTPGAIATRKWNVIRYGLPADRRAVRRRSGRPAVRKPGVWPINTFEMSAATAYLLTEVDPEMLLGTEAVANNSANMATTKTGSNRVQVGRPKAHPSMWSGRWKRTIILPAPPQPSGQRSRITPTVAVLNGDTTGDRHRQHQHTDDAAPGGKHYLVV